MNMFDGTGEVMAEEAQMGKLQRRSTKTFTSGNSDTKSSSGNVLDDGSLEDLLEKQRKAVEIALQFNQVIAERWATEKANAEKLAAEAKTPPSVKYKKVSKKPPPPVETTPPKPTPKFGSDMDPDLQEPLMKEDGSPTPPTIRINDIHGPDSPGKSPASGKFASGSGTTAAEKKSSMSWHMFPTLDGVKELVEHSLKKDDDDEEGCEDHFSKDGIFPYIARHPWFNNATMIVILMNTIWIAYDTDNNHEDLLIKAKIQFQIMGHFFCGFFSMELLVRFLAFHSKWNGVTDPWFAFELFLVLLMVWETWVSTCLYLAGYNPTGSGVGAGSVLRICRIFRLLRVARTGRVLNAVPELMILARGMFAGVRSVMVTLTLLALIIYIFSIVFTQLLAGTSFDLDNDSNFSTVPKSANYLLLQVLAGFDPDWAQSLLAYMPIGYLIFLMYTLLGSLTIMNMLIGILCDVVFSVANDEKEAAAELETDAKVDHLAAEIDISNRGCVTSGDFDAAIMQPNMIASFSDLDVDVAGLMDFAHFVFQENEELSYINFEHMVLQFQGAKPATAKDIMNMRKQMSVQLSKVLQAYEQTQAQLDSVLYEDPDPKPKTRVPPAIKDRPTRTATPPKTDADNEPSRPASISRNYSTKSDAPEKTNSRPSSVSPAGPAVASARSPGSSVTTPPPASSKGGSEPPTPPPRRFAYAPPSKSDDAPKGSLTGSNSRSSLEKQSSDGSPLDKSNRTSAADIFRKARETKAAAESFAKKYDEK